LSSSVVNAATSLVFSATAICPRTRAAGLVEHRHQMRLPKPAAVGAGAGAGGDVGAADGFAVQGQDLALLAGRDTVGCRSVGELGQHPRAHRGLDRGGVKVLQHPADRRGVGHHRSDAEQFKDRAAGVVGVLADRGERARPGQHRARPEQQDRQHPVAYPTA
jgi:hypothetical protein